MNKTKAFPIRFLLKKSQGFSLLEVLVGIIIITTFTLTALQALAIAVAFRVKAAQSSEATGWIEERIESTKFEASELEPADDEEKEALCSAETNEKGYGNKLKETIETLYPVETEHTINGTSWGVIDETGDFPGGTASLLRIAEPKAEAPFNVLNLKYAVVLHTPSGNLSQEEDDIITQFYTEVIPDAAFDCN